MFSFLLSFYCSFGLNLVRLIALVFFFFKHRTSYEWRISDWSSDVCSSDRLNSGGASTFYDLESIQVLKGPQGTLFGRNTTGGAVLYTSTKPKDEFGGYATLRGGNYGLAEGQGAINVPLLDHTLLLRIAGNVVHQDGWQKNLYDGRHLGTVSRQSGRVSLLWQPNDALQNLTVMSIDHVGGNSTATRLKTVNRCGDTNNGYALNCSADYLFNPSTPVGARSEEHTSELQSLMRISYAVFCLKKKNNTILSVFTRNHTTNISTHVLTE